MNLALFRKVNKKSRYKLDVAPEIRNLTIELTVHVCDSFKFLREILIRISKIVGPFWFHIPDAFLEDARYEITIILIDISNYFNCYVKKAEITRDTPAYYIEDTIEEFHDVIRGRIRGIIIRVQEEWRKIKNETVREKAFNHINYVVLNLIELLTDLQEGEKRLAKLFVKGL